jgi:phosphatidylinositol alpha-1,6-mannosyltransferase
VYAPEPDSALAALILRRIGRVRRVVFDVHEMYTGEALARWSPARVQGSASAVVHWGLRRLAAGTDLLVGVSEGVLDHLAPPSDRRIIVRNAPPMGFAETDEPKTSGLVMHGKATKHHGTEVVLRAFATAAAGHPDARLLVFDYFAHLRDGYTRDGFRSHLGALGIEDKVILQPLVPYAEMAAITARCEIGIIAYDRDWSAGSLPNKLFEYLAGGVAIVGQTYASGVRQVIEEHACGLTVDAESSDEIAEALDALLGDRARAAAMGAKGRAAFREHLSWEAQFGPVRAWLSGAA